MAPQRIPVLGLQMVGNLVRFAPPALRCLFPSLRAHAVRLNMGFGCRSLGDLSSSANFRTTKPVSGTCLRFALAKASSTPSASGLPSGCASRRSALMPVSGAGITCTLPGAPFE